jgi:hypothetical protein
MKALARSSAVVLFCAVALIPLPGQSLFLPQPVTPYRINEVRVEGLPAAGQVRVLVRGETFSGERIVLFEALTAPGERSVTAYLYVDPEIEAAQVELSREGRSPQLLQLPVEPGGYEVRIYCGGSVFDLDSPRYSFVGSVEQLQAGDVCVAGEAQAPRMDLDRLRARGVHLVRPAGWELPPNPREPAPGAKASAQAASAAGSSLQGLILGRLDPGPLTPGELGRILASHAEALVRFQESFEAAVGERQFNGLETEEESPGVFRTTRPEDVAYTLERRAFGAGVEPGRRLALLLFALPSLALVALVRRRRTLYVVLGVLLSLFLAYALLFPGRDHLFTLELNPSQVGQERLQVERLDGGSGAGAPPGVLPAPGGKGLSGLFGGQPRHGSYRLRGYSAAHWSLRYSLVDAYGRSTPLEPYLEAKLVKFNQRPRVTRGPAGYRLEFEGPLRSWSLHEPE